MPALELTTSELELILSALDSHRYWQLSDPKYLDSGSVRDPASDDPEAAEEIEAVNGLEAKLLGIIKGG